MAEAERLPPPLPPRLDWFVHTQMSQLAQGSVPEWFHGAISREAAEDLLASEPLGSFLIRVSHSHVGYTLSYKAPNCCRHFMVKLLDDGSFVIPGEKAAHASLDALVTFHQQKPIWPHEELLTQPCGQKDPANVDYEDLFLYSSALAEEATRPVPGLGEHQRPSSCSVAAPEKVPLRPALPHPGTARKPSAEPGRAPPGEAASSCPPRTPFREAGQRLWSSLKALPASGRIAQPQFRSALAALRSSLQEARPARGTPGPRPRADSRKHPGEAAWKDSVSGDPCVATASDPSQPQAPRPRDASARKATRPLSWSGATPAARGWHPLLARALSSREATPGPDDVAEPAEDLLPEEYLPPPPFAPGYC
nr:hematopoietic SH2 domain-containing protein isoform X1 [Marmota flaviventris]